MNIVLLVLVVVAVIVVVGISFGVLSYFNIYLGSNIAGMNPWSIMPGNLPDYLINLRNVYHIEAVKNIAITGAAFAVGVFIITYIYFKYFAVDSASITTRNGFASEVYECVGGQDNIKSCTSGLFRIMIEVNNFEKIDIERVNKMNASKIVQTKDGINIDVGSSAYIIARVINDKIKKPIDTKAS